MKIALAYDGVYANDPELWTAFIERADERGHTITIVTMRSEHNSPIEHEVGVDVIYTDLHGKRDFCESYGYEFDIWIEDYPEWIVRDHDHLEN